MAEYRTALSLSFLQKFWFSVLLNINPKVKNNNKQNKHEIKQT